MIEIPVVYQWPLSSRRVACSGRLSIYWYPSTESGDSDSIGNREQRHLPCLHVGPSNTWEVAVRIGGLTAAFAFDRM